MFFLDYEDDSDMYDEYDDDFGMHGYGAYGGYGIDPRYPHTADDYDEVVEFQMHMEAMRHAMFNDSYGSSDSNILPNSDYFHWEDVRMKDSHLLLFKATIPGVGLRDSLDISSMTGGKWSKIRKMEGKGGWLQSRSVMGYQDLYNLTLQVSSLLSAWKVRLKQCEGDWSQDQIKEYLELRKVTRSRDLGDESLFGQDGEHNPDPAQARDDTGLVWWLRQFLGSQEGDMTVEDRVRYSVGRGMVVFGGCELLDQLNREVCGVKNLVQNFLISVLASSLPIPLPYPVLLSLTKLLLSSGGAAKMGWSAVERASQLVESRYINRVYLAILDIYNVIREMMFKHAAETASPSFPIKFAFLRSTLAKNLSLLQSFQQLLRHEEPPAGNIFCKEYKELSFTLEPSRQAGIVLQNRIARNRVVVSGEHVFILHGVKGKGDVKGLVIAVHDLVTGDLIKEFTAVPQQFLAAKQYTLSTPVSVTGAFLVISLSQGYPYKGSSVTSSDKIFVINWVEENMVSSQEVPYSQHIEAAVKQMRDETGSDGKYPGDGEDDDNSLNSSFYDEDMVNSLLDVCLTEKNGCVFVLHREVVLPELEYKAEVDKWGQHVRIFSLQKINLVEELHDVRIIDVKAGLVIYEEIREDRSSKNKEGIFTQFSDVDVVVKWLDLLSGKEIFQESFVDTKEFPRPVYSIASHEEGGTQVLQYQTGKACVEIYKVDATGSLNACRQVSFPALSAVGYMGAELRINLISEDMLSFRHSVISPSLTSSMPVSLIRCVVAMAGSEEPLAEVFVPNDAEYEEGTKTSGHYLASPSESIVQEGAKLLLVGAKDEAGLELVVSVQQYEFFQPAIEVIKWDEETAKDIVEETKDQAIKKESKRSPACTDATLDALANEGSRVMGSLVNWCGSFGFLKLHSHPDTANVFIHISEISKPRPFLTAGVKMEVRLQKDLEKNTVKAVAARVLYF